MLLYYDAILLLAYRQRGLLLLSPLSYLRAFFLFRDQSAWGDTFFFLLFLCRMLPGAWHRARNHTLAGLSPLSFVQGPGYLLSGGPYNMCAVPERVQCY